MDLAKKIETIKLIMLLGIILFLFAIYLKQYIIALVVFPYYPIYMYYKLKKRYNLELLKNKMEEENNKK